MQKPVLRPHRVHERFEERDHIMLRDFLDFGNPAHVDFRLLSDLCRGPARSLAGPLERRTGLQLDFEPDLILTLEIPDGFHLRSGIPFDHLLIAPLTPSALPLTPRTLHP